MQLTNRRVRLMGTVIDVSIYHKEPEPLLDQVEALLHTYNKRFSANDDSPCRHSSYKPLFPFPATASSLPGHEA